MLKRLLFIAVLSMFAASLAQAALRAPQVPVSGTALATFFAAQGQAINVSGDQLDLQVLNVPATTNFEVRMFGPGLVGSTGFGAYNTSPASPPLYQIAPGAAAAGWFEVAAFRTGPTRMVVSIFDPGSSLQGTSTYLATDPTAFGFYEQTPTATFFTQDARNPSGAARILAYNGTGLRTGWTWFACETGAGPGGDFADVIGLVNLSFAPVPVQRTNWGRIKQLFR